MPDKHLLSDREVLLSARLLIADYKVQALRRAEQRIAEMKAKQDHAGTHAWSRIRAAVVTLLGRFPEPS